MSCSKSSEDFWNTTFKSSFNFDEDDDDEVKKVFLIKIVIIFGNTK